MKKNSKPTHRLRFKLKYKKDKIPFYLLTVSTLFIAHYILTSNQPTIRIISSFIPPILMGILSIMDFEPINNTPEKNKVNRLLMKKNSKPTHRLRFNLKYKKVKIPFYLLTISTLFITHHILTSNQSTFRIISSFIPPILIGILCVMDFEPINNTPEKI